MNCRRKSRKGTTRLRTKSNKEMSANLLRRSCLLILAAASLLQVACVTMTHPLSRVPEPVDKEIWEGDWQSPDSDVMTIRFTSNHVARVAWVDWKEGAFHLCEGEMIVTKGQRHNYLSMREVSEDNAEKAYTLAQYTFVNEGREMVLWFADTIPFSKAVKDGVLEEVSESTNTSPIVVSDAEPEPTPASKLETPGEDGTAEVQPVKRMRNAICLSSTPEKILEFLEDPKHRNLFKYDEPEVWRKIAPSKKD